MQQPGLDDPVCGQHAERDGEVVGRPGLADIGRCKIHGNPVAGELEARVADSGAHAIPALADARIRQAHHRENRQTVGHVDLHNHGHRLDAENGCAPQAGKHARRAASFSPPTPKALFRANRYNCQHHAHPRFE